MVTLEQKKKIVEDLTSRLEKASGVYMVNFEAMSVEKTNIFRSELKKKNLEYRVAKNTLIKRAISDVEGLEFPDDIYAGPSGVVLGFDDPVEPSKVLKDLMKKLERPAFKGALIEGEYYAEDKLEAITKLPSRADMIASIIGSLDAPMQGIVSSLGAPMQDMVNILNNTIGELGSVIEEVAKKQNND